MSEAVIMELVTERSKEDREKFFVKKGDCLYRYVNTWGEEQRECILINEKLIKDDKNWLGEPGNVTIDLELACKYQKVLEERFYHALLIIEELNNKVSQLCHIMLKKEYPEFQYKKEDGEELKRVKSRFRVEKMNDYSFEINDKIINQFKKAGCDSSFLEEDGESYFFLRDNMLYNCRKEDENKEKKRHIRDVKKSVNTVIENYRAEKEIEDSIIGKDITDANRERIKKDARKIAYKFIFLRRDWGVYIWFELIFLKFYKELTEKKPDLKFEDNAKCSSESLKERKDWLREESKKWFVEKENNYTWQLTEKAVMKLEELEEQDKRMDLMNYTIRLNLHMFSKINMIIMHSDVMKKTLDSELGLSERATTKRLQRSDVKDMNPYVACLLWKESNVSFERMFWITAINVTNQDRKIIDAYREVKTPKNSFSAIALSIEELEANSHQSAFWYMPKRDAYISRVCIELSGPEKIRMTVEYASAIVEPLVIELPCSYAMMRISELDDEKAAKIAEMAELGTKEALIKYCAEMMVRKYCREFLGLTYQRFQKIKCHANVTITIYPLVFYKPDGNIQVGYVVRFEGNEMTRSVGGECIGLYEKQLWKDRESLEEDWENVKEQMISLLKEEWIEINKSKKYYSEYAIHRSEFFQVVFNEPYIIGENDAERILKKICSGEPIWY